MDPVLHLVYAQIYERRAQTIGSAGYFLFGAKRAQLVVLRGLLADQTIIQITTPVTARTYHTYLGYIHCYLVTTLDPDVWVTQQHNPNWRTRSLTALSRLVQFLGSGSTLNLGHLV